MSKYLTQPTCQLSNGSPSTKIPFKKPINNVTVVLEANDTIELRSGLDIAWPSRHGSERKQYRLASTHWGPLRQHSISLESGGEKMTSNLTTMKHTQISRCVFPNQGYWRVLGWCGYKGKEPEGCDPTSDLHGMAFGAEAVLKCGPIQAIRLQSSRARM